jgi:hypothetical protein
MTVLIHGPCGTAVSEGSHRFLGKTSTVHEGFGCGAQRRPTGYKVMPSTQRALARRPDFQRNAPKAASRRTHSSAALARSTLKLPFPRGPDD